MCALAPVAASAQELGNGRFGGRTDHPDGTSTLTFGQRLALPWETRFGLDLAVANEPDLDALPAASQAVPSGNPSADSAWAQITLPGLGWDKTEVEARLIPFSEQARVGTTLSRRVPVGSCLAVTMETVYALTGRFAGDHVAGDSEVASHQLEAGARVGVDVLPTATKITLGQSYSSLEHTWLRTISAEQKLFGGPLSVNGSVSETATGDLAKTISAAFRLRF